MLTVTESPSGSFDGLFNPAAESLGKLASAVQLSAVEKSSEFLTPQRQTKSAVARALPQCRGNRNNHPITCLVPNLSLTRLSDQYRA